jgi:hypothetical protein
MRHSSTEHTRSFARFRQRVLALQPLLALVLILTASGQAAPLTPPPTSKISDPALHTLPTSLELARLLDLAAARLGINLEYDQRR